MLTEQDVHCREGTIAYNRIQVFIMFGAMVMKLCKAMPINTETTRGREGGELVNKGTQPE